MRTDTYRISCSKRMASSSHSQASCHVMALRVRTPHRVRRESAITSRRISLRSGYGPKSQILVLQPRVVRGVKQAHFLFFQPTQTTKQGHFRRDVLN